MEIFADILIKKVRSYWNKRPCNVKHSSARIGTKKYFNEVEKRKYFIEPHIPKFAEFDKWKGKNVLEIGCGIGTDTVNFARAKANVTTIDVSLESLAIACERASVFRLNNIRFYEGNAEELQKILPKKPRTYDLIYSFGVIHHTPHPERIIEQAKCYSHPGTILKIMVYYRYSWKVLWILLTYGCGAFWNLKKLIAKYSEAQIGNPITYTFTKREIKKLLNKYRFGIKEMWIDHIFLYKILDYKQYKYRKVWYFRYLPKCIFRWLEKKFGWHLCITAEKK